MQLLRFLTPAPKYAQALFLDFNPKPKSKGTKAHSSYAMGSLVFALLARVRLLKT